MKSKFKKCISKSQILGCIPTLVFLGIPALAQEEYTISFLDEIDNHPVRFSYAHAISGDGSTVVGAAALVNQPIYAFYWTAENGGQSLGSFPGAFQSVALDVSFDGSVIVGYSYLSTLTESEAFRWTVDGGMRGLGHLVDDRDSKADGVSSDGSVIVGYSASGGLGTLSLPEAFRWTEETGMVGLGFLGGLFSQSDASDISGDGTIIVGYSTTAYTGGAPFEAFRWTEETGMVGLGTLGGNSYANAISLDGSTIVGHSQSGFGSTKNAFRWTEETGIVALDSSTLGPLGYPTFAWDVSGDGSVIVGNGGDSSDTQAAFRWTEDTGMQFLGTLLEEAGVDLSGLTLETAEGVSADGTVIVGRLAHSQGGLVTGREGYIAVYNDGTIGLGNVSNLSSSAFATSHASKSAMSGGMQLGQGVMNGAANYRLTFPDPSQDFTRSTQGSSGWSHAAFATGTASWGQKEYSGLDQAYDGSVGLMAQSPGGLRLGFGLAASSMDGDTSSLHSNFDASGKGLVAFVAYEPTTSPWRFYGAATWLSLDADITRNYLNGAATETATGETDGRFWSVEARVAYELALQSSTSLRPYLSLLAGEADYDGYTETGGVFAGSVSAQNTSFRKAAVGLESSTAVSARLSITAEAELGHVRESGTNSSLSVVSLGGMTFGGGSGDRSYNVGTVGLGLIYQASARISLHANARYYGALESMTQNNDTLSLQLGLVTRF